MLCLLLLQYTPGYLLTLPNIKTPRHRTAVCYAHEKSTRGEILQYSAWKIMQYARVILGTLNSRLWYRRWGKKACRAQARIGYVCMYVADR